MFKPTATSNLLIESVKPHIKTGKLLDLGCGSGIVGRSLLKEGLDVYASDIDKDVCLHVGWDEPILSRQGSLFEPWDMWKFDYIVDDVSGVAKDYAFPWFEGVATAGEDGSDLVCKVIRQAPKYLTESGILFFPIVSLSNKQEIQRVALDTFENLTHIGHKDFILPKELQEKQIPKEYYKERFGIKLMYTDIYMCERMT